jgi:hypothetical protein
MREFEFYKGIGPKISNSLFKVGTFCLFVVKIEEDWKEFDEGGLKNRK